MPGLICTFDVEFGQNINRTRDRVNFGRYFRIGQTACHIIGFTKLAFDFHEEGLHR